MEKFRKWLIPTMLLVVALAVTAFGGATKFYVPSSVSQTTHTDYVLPTLESPGTGILTAATATWAFSTTAVAGVGTAPTGAKGVKLYAIYGNLVYGGSDLTTATAHLFPVVASGAMSEWIPIGTTTPVINFTGHTSTGTCRPIWR